MKRHRAATLIAGCLGGCALALGTPPSVEVASVQLRGLGLLDQSLDVGLCAYNPNDSTIAFRRINVGIDVAGAPLAEGVSELAVELPPHRAVLVPFAVSTTIRNLAQQIGAVLDAGTVRYRLHGTVQLAGSPGLAVPFSRSGQFDPVTAGQSLLADPAASDGVTAATCPQRG